MKASKSWLPYLLLSVLFWCLVLALIFSRNILPNDTADEVKFHLPTILTILERYPFFDLIHYGAATTPLYHLTLAAAAQLVGPGLFQLRIVSAGLSFVCLLTMVTYLRRRGPARSALFFGVLVLLSPYFLGPAARLNTDNTALFFGVLSLMMLDPVITRPPRFTAAALLITLSILTRQVYAWLIAVYAWTGLLKPLLDRPWRSFPWRRLLPLALPLAILLAFFLLWQGPEPPSFTSHQRHLSPQSPVYILSLLGLYGLFFLPWFWQIVRQQAVRWEYVLAAFLAGPLWLAVLPAPTLTATETGGMLWLLAGYLPVFRHTSLIFWLLLPLGTLWSCLLGLSLLRRRDYLVPVAFSAWALANMFNAKVYQRYYDPLLLFFFAYALLPIRPSSRLAWLPPIALLAAFGLRAGSLFLR